MKTIIGTMCALFVLATVALAEIPEWEIKDKNFVAPKGAVSKGVKVKIKFIEAKKTNPFETPEFYIQSSKGEMKIFGIGRGHVITYVNPANSKLWMGLFIRNLGGHSEIKVTPLKKDGDHYVATFKEGSIAHLKIEEAREHF